MTQRAAPWSDHAVEQLIGRLLQFGVLLAAAVVLLGAILLLVQHGTSAVSYRTFVVGPDELRSMSGIVRGAFAMDSRAIIQLGLLLLIATPVARVAFTLVAFALQRDRVYVLITAIVLALLLYGLVLGRA
jgi:uncharacterized membrane protein